MESLLGQFSNHPYIILGIFIRIVKITVFFHKKKYNIYKGVFLFVVIVLVMEVFSVFYM
jgi:hypothetical protein